MRYCLSNMLQRHRPKPILLACLMNKVSTCGEGLRVEVAKKESIDEFKYVATGTRADDMIGFRDQSDLLSAPPIRDLPSLEIH